MALVMNLLCVYMSIFESKKSYIKLSKLLYLTADSVSNRIHIHANVKQTAGESDEEV